MHFGRHDVFFGMVTPSWCFLHVFFKDSCKSIKFINDARAALRPAVLDLADRFESAGGWASETVFSKWVSKQEWRQCLPSIFEFAVDRETCLRSSYFSEVPKAEIFQINTCGLSQRMRVWSFWRYRVWTDFFLAIEACLGTVEFLSGMHEANAPEHSKMDKIKLGMFLPHEVASAFYHFRSGDLFFGLLTGTPDVT